VALRLEMLWCQIWR